MGSSLPGIVAVDNAFDQAFLAGRGEQATVRSQDSLSRAFEELLLALAGDGTPCPPSVFEQRFQQFIAQQMAGCDPSRVRISLEW